MDKLTLLNQIKMVSSQSYDAIKDINPTEQFDDNKYEKYVYAVDSINNACDAINEFIDNTSELRQSLFEILGKFKEIIGKIKTFADKISNYELAVRAQQVEQVVNESMSQEQFEPTILGAPEVPGRSMDKPKVRTLTPNYNQFKNAA